MMHISLFLSLSLYIYIYIYIYAHHIHTHTHQRPRGQDSGWMRPVAVPRILSGQLSKVRFGKAGPDPSFEPSKGLSRMK